MLALIIIVKITRVVRVKHLLINFNIFINQLGVTREANHEINSCEHGFLVDLLNLCPVNKECPTA